MHLNLKHNLQLEARLAQNNMNDGAGNLFKYQTFIENAYLYKITISCYSILASFY